MTVKSSLHRLSKVDEDSIYYLVKKQIRINPEDNTSARRDKERRQEAFEQFQKQITPVYKGSPRKDGPMRLCYEHIPDLLEISGLTYLDIFRAIAKDLDGNKIKPGWATAEEEKMCVCCDMLSSEQCEKVKELVKALLPDDFEYTGMQDLSPLQKIVKANGMHAYCGNETARQVTELGIEKQYRRRNIPYSFNAIEFNLLPFFSQSFDVSLHWLLGLNEKTCVLADNGETEIIMTLFCFLPEERKSIILKAVETAMATGGVL